MAASSAKANAAVNFVVVMAMAETGRGGSHGLRESHLSRIARPYAGTGLFLAGDVENGDDLLKLFRGQTRVGGHDGLRQRGFTSGEGGFHVALEQGGKRLFVLPFRMLWRQRFDAVHREEKLEIQRLLGPERAVVVEGRDALGHRNKIGGAFLGDFFDEGGDGLFGRAVVPGRKRIGGMQRCRDESERNENQ